MNSWVVQLNKDNTWQCSQGYGYESACRTATLMMMKYWPKRDMTQATIRNGVFGMPFLDAPLYIDHTEPRNTPLFVCAVEAPTRHHAIKIAKQSWAGLNLSGIEPTLGSSDTVRLCSPKEAKDE